MTPLVQIENASVFIPGDISRRLILKNFNLIINKFEHCAILGPNGSGKSTLLKVLHGALPLAQGSIAWRDQTAMSPSRITGQEMSGLISPHIQSDCQIYAWNVSVADFIANGDMAMACAASTNNHKQEAALKLLARLSAAHLAELSLPQLSRGQLRLALLCRELLREPQLLLLDEWSDSLDQRRAQLLTEILGEYSVKTTMVFTGHREDAIPGWAQRRLWLRDGALSPRPQTGAASNFTALPPPPPRTAANAQIVYQITNASVYIDSHKILHDINWKMRAGEHWRIVGANGSGKSTFLRLLAGDEAAAAGGCVRHFSIKFNKELHKLAEKRLSAVLVSDLNESLYGYPLTALETVLSGAAGSVGLWQEADKNQIAKARKLLALLFDESIEDCSIRMLSSGQLRRVFLARALMCNPDILLLDEPFAGLDLASRTKFQNILQTLALQGASGIRPQIVFVSHYDEDAPAFITHTARMIQGRLQPA